MMHRHAYFPSQDTWQAQWGGEKDESAGEEARKEEDEEEEEHERRGANLSSGIVVYSTQLSAGRV